MQFETINANEKIYNNLNMNNKYLYLYNKLINYTRNKELYKNLNRTDNFSDRLTLFLLHFSFFLKNFKNNENKNEKAAIIYQVLTSEKFANQVRRIFEVYSAMLKQVEKDYQYHTKSAATRKAQLQNFGNFMMDLLGFLEGQGDGDDFTKLVESFDITNEKNENVSIAFTK